MLPLANHIAQKIFGLTPTCITQLNGEYDANFCVETRERKYLLRLSHENETAGFVHFQTRLLNHLAESPAAQFVQAPLQNVHGEYVSIYENRFARLFTWLDGRVLAQVQPHLPDTLRSVGHMLGKVDAASQGFAHAGAVREMKWDLSNASWIAQHVHLVQDSARRRLIETQLTYYTSTVQPALGRLRRSVIHNDANDYNLLAQGTGYAARASGLIDFGDALLAPTVCNLAIALAYLMLDKPDPIASAQHVIRGYSAAFALHEDELAALFALAQMRLCMSVVNSAIRKTESDDPYIVISEAPAWRTLERLAKANANLAQYQFRQAAGFEPHPNAPRLRRWLVEHQSEFASVVNTNLRTQDSITLDLSVGSLDMGLPDETDSSAKFAQKLERELGVAQQANGSEKLLPGIGRYNEPRLIYACDDFATQGEHGKEFRTVHMGFDVFQPAGSPVFAPLAGVVHSFADNTAKYDYGPCIILAHTVLADGMPLEFFTLYGHLSRESLFGLRVGQPVAGGQRIAEMGNYPINGDWAPHLHFQIILDLLDMHGTFPGVARPSDRDVWMSLCPDPNLIVGMPAHKLPSAAAQADAILAERKTRIGYNLSISYKQPIVAARGQAQYLYDEEGCKYLDGYNNVPHVGHNHPHVVRAAQRQLSVLNTNTRYLHKELVRYARRLTDTLPEPLRVCFFVTSGSEATELALRLARAHTGQRDLIVSDGAYHGHTSTLIDISPYKAEGPGGTGLPNWVHKAAVPDVFRGAHRGADAGQNYAQQFHDIVANIHAHGHGLSGFIIESIPSVGGQIVLPTGYLPAAYEIVRAAGGVCMADEVQTGFGRIGTHLWAFQHYGVVPDIVALGKPIGNGYPMGAVVTTPEIAASFDNGMEFFSTFGGSTVACAVGNAVLDVVETEQLMAHANVVGDYFLAGLNQLKRKHKVIGDVRGMGLMLGLELVDDLITLSPAVAQASYVANRMKDKGILIGTDGIFHNVLKVRGPMCMTCADVDYFLVMLDDVLGEDAAQALH